MNMTHQVHGGPTGEQVTAEGEPVTAFREVAPGDAGAQQGDAPQGQMVTVPRAMLEQLVAKHNELKAAKEAAEETVKLLTGTAKQRKRYDPLSPPDPIVQGW